MRGMAVGGEVRGREQAPGVLTHQQRAVGPVAHELAIVPAALDHDPGQAERQRAVGAGAHAEPLVRPRGRAGAPRVHHDQGRAAPHRLGDRGGLGQVGRGRVVAPQEQAPGALEVRRADVGAEGERGRVVAVPRAHLLAPHHVRAAEGADQAIDPREAVGDGGAGGGGDGEGHRLRPLALGQRAHALRGPVEGLVPADAHPARIRIGARPRALHRVEEPVRRVDQLGGGPALHAEVLAGGMRGIRLHRGETPFLHHRDAAAARATERAEAGDPLGGHRRLSGWAGSASSGARRSGPGSARARGGTW